ncbi:MAG: sugar transferase [Acidobacteria bacterium]|nr:sugar transferase [Acidobacteriota bacterium]MCI0718374.1 sugar transferase [Acidobacteriota bacterium]
MLKVFNQYLPSRTLFLLVSETVLILAGILLAAAIQSSHGQDSKLLEEAEVLKALLIAFVCQLCLYYHDLYDLQIVKERGELFARLLQAMGVWSILIAGIYVLFPSMFLGQGVSILAVFLLLVSLVAWRVAFFWLSQRTALATSTLILGTGDLARKIAAEVSSRPEVGIRIVGFVSEDRTLVGKSIVNPTVLGEVADLGTIVDQERVSEVVVAMPEGRGRLPFTELLDLKLKGLSIIEATSLYEKLTGKIAVESLRPSWLIFSEGFRKSPITHFYKRLFGILFSTFGLIVLMPVMVLVALLIKLDSRGPVLFRQKRVGEGGKTFDLLKFRSMHVDAEAASGPVWAQKDDSRITHVGKFIRKVRLDELPQFINVLKGDMSFVGPRPERPHFVAQLGEKIPYYSQRHTVKPGITGWAQVRYHYGGSIGDTIEKLQYDLYYIKHMSIALDLLIIFQTIKIVLLRRGSL